MQIICTFKQTKCTDSTKVATIGYFSAPPPPWPGVACSFVTREREHLCSELRAPLARCTSSTNGAAASPPFLSTLSPAPISWASSHVWPASICLQLHFYSSPVVFMLYFHLQRTTNWAGDSPDPPFPVCTVLTCLHSKQSFLSAKKQLMGRMIPSLPLAISTLLKPSGLPIYTLSKCLASGLLYVHNFQSQVMGEEIAQNLPQDQDPSISCACPCPSYLHTSKKSAQRSSLKEATNGW